MKKYILPGVVLFSTVLFSFSAEAKLKTQTIKYKDGEQLMQGYLAYDDSFKGKRPGVLVIHEWTGLNDYAKLRSEQLAKLGYVAFASGIHEKGNVPKNADESENPAGKNKVDLKLRRERTNAGLNVLRNYKLTDAKKGLLLVTITREMHH